MLATRGEGHLRNAIRRLETTGRVIEVSSVYETELVEFTEQPWFLNCAVAFETGMGPRELITALLGIEEAMGRRRVQTKGPRSIDIDILLFENEIIDSKEPDSKELTIPHPAMHERRFVLEPLAEIAPQVLHPVLKRTIRELRDALPTGQAVKKLKT